ncbi:MAG: ribosome maturation factor RimP [Lachnospiraceae bacterium]|nr:ribosome maturation factor RimP [Lachnospiraceae bacterium]
MSKREDYERRTEALIQPILDRLGFVMWDVEYVKEGADHYLRTYIDKENGITIDDCVEVSRALSDELDREDFIDEAYILEVSSPGLGRALKKDKDFERSIGQSVDVKTYKPIDGLKQMTGVLLSYDKDSIEISAESGEKIRIGRSDLAKVNLSVDF